ncbi:MAG: Panacea domain-containing protein [Rubrobacteraceae bacterium]
MDAPRRFGPQNLTYGSDDPESREKLRELILFVSERCQNDGSFGVTKLNKVLFYADFFSFAKYGESITGISYNKLPYGPVPTAATTVRSQMEAEDEAFLTKQGYSPYQTHRLIPRREANLDLFKARDIALVDGVIEALADLSGRRVSELSHGRAWESVADFERIPYEAAFVDDTPLTEVDVAAAHEMLDEFEHFDSTRD